MLVSWLYFLFKDVPEYQANMQWLQSSLPADKEVIKN